MPTNINWQSIGPNKFNLMINHELIGEFEATNGLVTRDAKIFVAASGENYTVKSPGFWMQRVEIANAQGETVLKASPEKWYANSLIFNFGGQDYKLKIRNNPLAEWVIQNNNTDILAYGLQADNGKVSTRISVGSAHVPVLFHFLLWYLFKDISLENASDDATFLLLATA
jgi:hypothetical protein